MDRRNFLRAVSGTGITLGLAGCVGGGASAGGDYDVGMSARRFDPGAIEVKTGTTVVWRNTSSITNTVTAYENQIPDGAEFFSSGDFDSQAEAESAWVSNTGGGIHQAQTYEHEFTVPGDYAYFCVPHEASGMTGVVTVVEE